MNRAAVAAAFFAVFPLAVLGSSGCSTPGSAIKTQAYAEAPSHRVFEFEFNRTWAAIESAFRNLKVVEREPADVAPLELAKLKQRKLETDWIYSQSRDKYQEFEANGSPRKIFLQGRWSYRLVARTVVGGTEVSIETQEEIQPLKADGTGAGYKSMSRPDPGRASEMLDRIQAALLAAPNT